MRKSLKLAVAGGALALALLYSGIGYVTGSVPFPAQQRGDLTTAELCDSMGGDAGGADGAVETAKRLAAVLPAKGEYSSSGENPLRQGDDTSWRSSCRVYGDDDQLLYASAELGWDAPSEKWLDDPSRNYVREEGRGTQFRAGNAAVVMKQTAQILVSCVPREGEGSPSPYQLVIEVHAQQPLEGSASENRQALATTALTTARSAHEQAECSLPSKLPSELPAKPTDLD
jgi:hypothetical protein